MRALQGAPDELTGGSWPVREQQVKTLQRKRGALGHMAVFCRWRSG